MKTVSIIIPYLNGERYIEEAVTSLREQTYRNIQVVLVDNGSTDGSLKIARSAFRGDRRFRIVKEPRRGIANALNRGIRETSGHLISFLDMDDFYLKDYIQHLVDYYETTDADSVACNGRLVNEKSEVYGEFDPYTQSEEMVPLILFQINIIWTMSFLSIRRSVAAKQPVFSAQYDLIPDLHLILSCLSRGLRLRFLDEPLVGKRYHKENAAYNSDIVEQQCFRRLLEYKSACPRISEFYTEKDIRLILTERYVRAIRYLRRKELWQKIPGYMEEYVRSGYINKHVYHYFNALALMHTDRVAFAKYIVEKQSRHPLWHFSKGLMYWTCGEYEQACVEFETAYASALRRFPEALNSLSLAAYFLNPSRAGRMNGQIQKHWPKYEDAKENANYILEGRPERFKHTFALTPDTLTYLSGMD